MANKEQDKSKGLEIEQPVITEIEHISPHPQISEKEAQEEAVPEY